MRQNAADDADENDRDRRREAMREDEGFQHVVDVIDGEHADRQRHRRPASQGSVHAQKMTGATTSKRPI